MSDVSRGMSRGRRRLGQIGAATGCPCMRAWPRHRQTGTPVLPDDRPYACIVAIPVVWFTGEGAAAGPRAGRTGATRTPRFPFPVRVQVGQRGVLTVALKGRPRLPFDQDEHLPGSDVADRALPEPAQGQHAPSVPGDLAGRPARVGQVLLTVGDIEQVERVDLRLLSCHIPTLGQRTQPTGTAFRMTMFPAADPDVRPMTGPLLERPGWASIRSGIEKRHGVPGP